MDADFSHDPHRLPGFISMMGDHDLVIGSRYAKGIAVVNWSLKRLFLSLSANLYARWITGLELTDCTSGFKCFRRESSREHRPDQSLLQRLRIPGRNELQGAPPGLQAGRTADSVRRPQGRPVEDVNQDSQGRLLAHFKMRMDSMFRPVNFARQQVPTLVAVGSGGDQGNNADHMM